ncbi:MAG: tetratricopeptide repeat protein, partial [Gemmatimonadales bacterium]
MARRRSTYWRGFLPLAAGSLGLLLLFVFGLMPQRFLLDLDFAESGFAYPVVLPPLPLPMTTTPPPLAAKPIARGPAERLWAEYVRLVEAGDPTAALRMLEEYLERHPGDRDARLEYARALWRAGRLENAVESYRMAMALGAGPEARQELARLLVAMREWEAAVELYEEMVAESPADLELRREYARTLAWAERYDEALAIYATLAEVTPDDEDLLREYAAIATWAERYDLALALYARLVELSPDDPELRVEWARVLLWAFQPEAAAEALAGLPPGFAGPGVDSLRLAIEQALPVMSATGASLLEQARMLAWTAEPDSALSLYRRFLSEHPEADSVLLEMADIFQYRADARDSAMAYLSAYLVRHPDSDLVQLRLAWLLAWSGRYYEAETLARGILADNPENAEAWVLLGDLYRWQGERKRSAEAYRRALEIDPWVVGAADGLAALEAQLEAQLAARGTIGAAGGFETFADNDDFSLVRLRGGWVGGSPATRVGVEMSVERLRGLQDGGESAELFAFAVEGTAHKWFSDGNVGVHLSAGAWVPDSGGSAQPTLGLSIEAPDWRGGAYR